MAKDDKVFDVAKPGKAASPDIGSKPMIVGHKSTVSDPMVNKDSTKDNEKNDETIEEIEEKQKAKKTASKMRIEPLSKDIKPEEDKKVEEPKDKVNTKPEEPTKEAQEKPKTEKTEDKPEEKTGEKTEENKEDKKDGKLDPAAIAMEQQDKLDKLIDSKKYNVGVKQAKSNSMKTFVLVFFSLVIAGFVALFILIDTNTVDVGVDLPFRIFGSEETIEVADSPATKQSDAQVEQEDLSKARDSRFPLSWGAVSEDANSDEYSRFAKFPKLSIKIHEGLKDERVSMSFQVTSECEYDGVSEWSPVDGDNSPSDCPSRTRLKNDLTVYVFEFGALGAYAYNEVVVLDGVMFEIIETSDFEEDFDDADSAPEIKNGVVERITDSVQQRVTELIEVN